MLKLFKKKIRIVKKERKVTIFEIRQKEKIIEKAISSERFK